jgi:hypothetical protein
MPNERRIVFVGHHNSGKDEAATFLCSRFSDLTYGRSVSWYVAQELASKLGVPVETLRGPDRHKYAMDFFRFGEARDHDPAHFLRLAFEAGNVVTGIQDPREIEWGRGTREVDQFVWIDRLGILPDPTMVRMRQAMCDVTIANHGDLAVFHRALGRWADFSGFTRLDKGTPSG